MRSRTIGMNLSYVVSNIDHFVEMLADPFPSHVVFLYTSMCATSIVSAQMFYFSPVVCVNSACFVNNLVVYVWRFVACEDLRCADTMPISTCSYEKSIRNIYLTSFAVSYMKTIVRRVSLKYLFGNSLILVGSRFFRKLNKVVVILGYRFYAYTAIFCAVTLQLQRLTLNDGADFFTTSSYVSYTRAAQNLSSTSTLRLSLDTCHWVLFVAITYMRAVPYYVSGLPHCEN